MLNTTQLECFLAVANCLNFSRAAEQLRLTQPAVSHQISTLEDELGVKLFKRTSKSVRLTQEGYLYTQYAGEIMRLFNVSRGRLKAAQSERRRVLGVGCRRGTEESAIARAVDAALEKAGLDPLAVQAAATIDLKAEEPGLLAFCRSRKLPLRIYSAGELSAVPGTFTPSAFVQSVTGVDNVCERAAAARGGTILLGKTARDGVTVAIAQEAPFAEGSPQI